LATALAVMAARRQFRSLEEARDSASNRASETERRNAELDQFAGRVAHDVLSPLMGAAMSLELAKARLEGDAKAQESLRRGTSSLVRARRIVEGLLEFARAGGAPQKGAVADVRAVALDVIGDARADAEAQRIDIVIEPFDACTVGCSYGVLVSLFANLVRNSMKHMGESASRHRTADEPDAARRSA
jgi:signal transduction histidine kinase